LEALADQIAVAINKARQFRAQRERAWIATAQLQVAEAVGQSSDMQSMAEAIVRLLTILVGAKTSILFLWDDQLDGYNIVAQYGYGDPPLIESDTASISLGDWPALDAVHVTKEMLVTYQLIYGIGRAVDSFESDPTGTAETWLLPLLVKSQTIGILAATFPKGGFESKPKVRREILRNVAVQTAQGIDAIKLQQALQEEAWVNTALLQVAETVNRLTDLDEILYSIVRLVPMLVGVKNAVVLIWDDEGQCYRAGPSHGISEMAYGTLESFDIDLKEFPLLEKQELERAGPDSAYYTFKLPAWMSTVLGSSTAGIFPLRARGRLVGVLVVGPTKSGQPLSGRRLNIVIGIAQQAAIAVVNDHLYRESAERNRMDQELDMAHTIQSSLLPSENPEIPGCSVAGYWQAARQVSGDFYDFMHFDDGRLGIAIADVTDKGIPAALFMALSRTILRTVAFNRRSPADALHRTNEIVYGDTTSDHFVTVFYAVWDPTDHTLQYANGGHNPPLLMKKNGTSRLLSSEGVALGVIEDVKFAEKTVRLQKGDTIVFYTDGVTEAVNEDFDEFGLERLIQVVRSTSDRNTESIINSITEAIADHAGNTPQFDDITLVVMKR
jgi:serine phosphatase RsbU (regulator of sigma subunit)